MLHFDRNMSATETLMWHVESDPWLSPNGGGVAIYEGVLDFERYRNTMAYVAAQVLRFRQRVIPGPGPLSPPHWTIARDLDLDWHVRRIGAPGDGSLRALLDWAGQFLQDPYDRTRPLWQNIVVEGLSDGTCAVVGKIHHTVTDGAGAMRYAQLYNSPARHTADHPVVDLATLVRHEPESHHGIQEEVVEAASGALHAALDLTRGALDAITHPSRVRESSHDVADLVRVASDQAQPAGSLLWSRRSRRRRLEVLSQPFAETREAAHRWGGTMNDLLLTGAVEAARAYHLEKGEDPEHFHVTFVVSTRTDPASGANAFTPVPVQLPAGEMPLAERFRSIRDLLRERRGQVHGRGPMAAVAGMVALLPTPVVTSLVRRESAHIDFATSNVPGFFTDCYTAGAKLLHSYPFGPVAGTAFNLTQLTVGDHLDLGINVDPEAVTDSGRLAELLEEHLGRLVAGH
jgi:diacylglycerol O-acyltransferase